MHPWAAHCGYRWFYYFCLLPSPLALCVDDFLLLFDVCLYQWAFPFWNFLVYSCDLFFFVCFFLYLLVTLGLCYCMRAFSSCDTWGDRCQCGARASHWSGFSGGAQAPGAGASGVVACGLSSCGSCSLVWVVMARGLTCSIACGMLPDQRQAHALCTGRPGTPDQNNRRWRNCIKKKKTRW